MKLLVCGGRDYGRYYPDIPLEEQERSNRQRRHVYRTLDAFVVDNGPITIIQGGAPGADTCAKHWATRNLVPVETVKADWKAHGRAAGPIRNQRMIDEFRPDIVMAFPGGRGTTDMVERAKAAGIKVIEVTG